MPFTAGILGRVSSKHKANRSLVSAGIMKCVPLNVDGCDRRSAYLARVTTSADPAHGAKSNCRLEHETDRADVGTWCDKVSSGKRRMEIVQRAFVREVGN